MILKPADVSQARFATSTIIALRQYRRSSEARSRLASARRTSALSDCTTHPMASACASRARYWTEGVYTSPKSARRRSRPGRLVAGRSRSARNRDSVTAATDATVDVWPDRASRLAARRENRRVKHPFGALLVLDGAVVLTAQNTVGDIGRPDRARGNQARRRRYPAADTRSDSARAVRLRQLRTVRDVRGRRCIGPASARSSTRSPAQELAIAGWRELRRAVPRTLRPRGDRVDVTGPLLVDEAREVHLGIAGT